MGVAEAIMWPPAPGVKELNWASNVCAAADPGVPDTPAVAPKLPMLVALAESPARPSLLAARSSCSTCEKRVQSSGSARALFYSCISARA